MVNSCENDFWRASAVLPLRGVVQHYAWGAVGAASRIAPFLERYEATQPLAEFWIGSHAKAPAEVQGSNGAWHSLATVISAAPVELLGASVVKRFGPQLPFLLKVLSVNPDFGLSIQAHPDLQRAAQLHQRDPMSYPDSNHKPEVLCALTPVTLLYGLRRPQHLREVVQRYGALGELLGAPVCEAGGRDDEGVLRAVWERVLRSSPEVVRRTVDTLEASATMRASEGPEAQVFRRLVRTYDRGDVGLLALFLMNIVEVPVGAALFTGPNVPHAYLSGDMVECMACSDNVVRAGLTTKYRDVETLLEMLDYNAGPPEVLTPTPLPQVPGVLSVQTPAREFKLRIVPHGDGLVQLAPQSGVAVGLVLGAEVTVRGRGGAGHRFGDGGAFLLPPDCGMVEVSRCSAAVYLVEVGSG